MAVTFDELIEPADKDDYLASELSIAAALGLPETSWQPGAVGRTILEIVAQQFANADDVRVLIAKGGFLDFATGSWLTVLAQDVYDVTRIEATFATGPVTLTNTTGSPIIIGVAAVHLTTSAGLATYRNTIGTTVPASSSVTIDFIADQAGAIGSANAGAISVFVTPVIGLTASNPDPFVGVDEESDLLLAQRCRDALGRLSPDGPSAAYVYFAKTATRADGTPIGVTRVQVIADSSTGLVTVWVADASGAIAGGDVTYVNTAVQQNAVPLGINAAVVNATEVNVQVVATVYARAPVPTADQIVTELVNFFGQLPIAAPTAWNYIYLDEITGAIWRAFPSVTHVVLTLPAATVALAAGRVPVCTSVSTDITVVVVT